MPSKQQLGARIKRFRLERNLTLKDVELRARVSATHVSEIERGMTSPTVGALIKIARALGTEPSYFLENSSARSVSIMRRKCGRSLHDTEWGARIRSLSDGVRLSDLSFLDVELEAAVTKPLAPFTHAGEELVHILKGVVEITIGTERHLLKEGDTIHFHSREPHTFRNIGDGAARILWVASPPFHL